jgi:hypothetical protein
MFAKSGGFGRFQIISTLILTIAMSSTSIFLMSVSFLELTPAYECLDNDTNEWYKCESKDFCEIDGINWKVNWNEITSLHNLIE